MRHQTSAMKECLLYRKWPHWAVNLVSGARAQQFRAGALPIANVEIHTLLLYWWKQTQPPLEGIAEGLVGESCSRNVQL